MRKFCLVNILFLSFISVSGQGIDETVAKIVGLNFLMGNASSASSRLSTDLELSYKVSSTSNDSANVKSHETYLYVFNTTSHNGFVIVSGNENTAPILGYSDTRSFDRDNIPRSVAKWLESYKAQIRDIADQQIPATETISEQWKALKSGKPSSLSGERVESVGPLIQTKWNQAPFYNAQCPLDASSGKLTYTGCVATAMAQIMKFWNYPVNGAGFHSDNDPKYGTLSVNFGGTNYQWNSMPSSINNANTPIATLMYDCGVSVNMQYGIDESLAYTQAVANSLTTYFQYSSSVQFVTRDKFSDADWIALLKGELDAGRPIEYSGAGSNGGHAFVCDGYDANGLFHFNWGWGGQGPDGYFQLNSLNPPILGIGGGQGGFNGQQTAVIGIQPPPSVQTYNLGLYNTVSSSAVTIGYLNPFTITTNIVNNGTNNFSGDYAAVVFDQSLNFVGLVQTLSGYTLNANYAYTNNLTFSTNGMLSMLPGTYDVLVFYRPTGGNWIQVSNSGSYTNLVQITVTNTNTIALNSAMVLTPGNTLTQGLAASVNLNIANNGTNTFTGEYGVGLYSLSDGTLAQGLGSVQETNGLPAGYTYQSPYLTFTTSSITVSPGTYLLALEHNPTPANSATWQLTGAGSFSNPISVKVVAPQLQPDKYEPNNSVALAYNLPVSFSGTSASVITTGSNIDSSIDNDFYKVTLPIAYDYTINARLDDATNGNGNTYTLDAVVSYSTDGSIWSDTYVNVITPSILMKNGGTLYFHVAPFFVGGTGTYQLEINLSRPLTTGIEAPNFSGQIDVYLNPSSKSIFIDYKTFNGEVSSISMFSMQGQQVLQYLPSEPSKTLELPVSNLNDGLYILQIQSNTGFQFKKIIVKK